MREEFSAYRGVDQRKLKKLWSTAIFSFDANTLLDLYESEVETTEQFFSILEGLKGRIWLAHQAGQEFYENRNKVIARGRRELGRLEEVSKASPNFLRSSAAEKIAKILKDEAEHLQSFLDDDPIETRVDKLFKGKVGDPYPSLHEKYIEAEQRFKLKIPPGFRDDASKDDYRKYGDAILWFQLPDHASQRKKNIIFVTAESKTDWWLSGDQKKRLGPRPELAQEMKARARVEFHMYSPTEFVKHADDLLGVRPRSAKVKQAVQDLQRIEKQREAPALPTTDWLVNSLPGYLYTGQNRPLSYVSGVPGLGSSQVFYDATPGLNGISVYPSRLFDAAGKVIFPPAGGAIFVTPETKVEIAQSAEQEQEKNETDESKPKK